MNNNDSMQVSQDNPVRRIVLEYEDGTIREVGKGFIADMAPDGDGNTISFDFVGIGGKDIEEVVYGVTELGIKLGLFNE